MVFHVSEEPGISEFTPRPSKYTPDPVVWAVDDEKIRNYLVPRDCPRVTYYAGAETAPEDRARFLGTSAAVVAIEAESHRRRGIGTRMITQLKGICSAQNVMKMWVPTGRSNVAATRLYASTGATPLPSGDEVTYAYTRESFTATVSE